MTGTEIWIKINFGMILNKNLLLQYCTNLVLQKG